MPFASDNFNDTSGTNLSSHTPSGGGSWTKHASYAQDILISDANRARANSFNDTAYYHSGSPATAEYDVEATVWAESNSGQAGVAGRIATGANTMYLARFRSSNGWELVKISAGTSTILGTYSGGGTSLTVDTNYALKLEIRDATKKLYVDGVERVSSSDNAITAAGQAGVRNNTGSNTTGYHLDDWSATDASTAQTISPSGIASAEAFGTAVLTPGAVTISPSGIATAEAFGTASINQTIAPAGIASAEAFGDATLTPGAVTVSPGAIASIEAFGDATVTVDGGTQTVSPVSIDSEEAFGAALLGLTVGPAGIASDEAFGTLALALAIVPSGIESVEAFGTPALGLVILTGAIGSGEAFGDATLTLGAVVIAPAGIASGEAFGIAVVSLAGAVVLPLSATATLGAGRTATTTLGAGRTASATMGPGRTATAELQ